MFRSERRELCCEHFSVKRNVRNMRSERKKKGGKKKIKEEGKLSHTLCSAFSPVIYCVKEKVILHTVM